MSNEKDWIDYTPGDAIPEEGTWVQIKCRDHVANEGEASAFEWGNLGPFTIISYRVIEPDVEWLP